MAEEKVKKEEVVENKTEKRGWKRDVLFLLLGAIMTALTAGIVTWFLDWRKDKKTTEDLMKIISSDVKITVSDLNNFLGNYDREKMIENSKEDPEWTLYMTDYDTSVLDAYIHKIPLLPKNQAEKILLFYKHLRIINEAKDILQKEKLSSKNRGEWTNTIYVRSAKAAEHGKAIIKFCSRSNISEPDDTDSSKNNTDISNIIYDTGTSTTK
ncbi:MAG: hypothetical protein JW837_05125 [Sedimentisphaerales bacterium]|nr:hypothetical protein [Sedimentisphaerales bacterium]